MILSDLTDLLSEAVHTSVRCYRHTNSDQSVFDHLRLILITIKNYLSRLSLTTSL